MFDFERIVGKLPFGTVISAYPSTTAVPPPFAFVLNVSAFVGGKALEIAPGYILRRATEDEVDFTIGLIQSLFAQNFGRGLWEERRPESGSGKYVKLSKNKRRYHVIQLPDDHQKFASLERALAIASCELEVGLVASKASLRNSAVPICMYSPPRLFQSLTALQRAHDSEPGSGEIFTEGDAEEVKRIWLQIDLHKNSILDLESVFKLLFNLKDLPHFSPLQVFEYFAILESLLTHQPNPEDRYDSITRQITQKLALLNKRWDLPLDYTGFGSQVHKKIWQEMYAYRSTIAHGAKPDFKSRFQTLKSAKNADELIKETVKKTIRQALIEPQLLADLHEC